MHLGKILSVRMSFLVTVFVCEYSNVHQEKEVNKICRKCLKNNPTSKIHLFNVCHLNLYVVRACICILNKSNCVEFSCQRNSSCSDGKRTK
jgi:hypothetical protein